MRSLIEQQWESLRQPIEELLKDRPRPDALWLSGRGALIDGFAEWVERTVGVTTVICRSPRTNQHSDLSRQVSLNAVMGTLHLCARTSREPQASSPYLFNRLLERTRTILTEYF